MLANRRWTSLGPFGIWLPIHSSCPEQSEELMGWQPEDDRNWLGNKELKTQRGDKLSICFDLTFEGVNMRNGASQKSIAWQSDLYIWREVEEDKAVRGIWCLRDALRSEPTQKCPFRGRIFSRAYFVHARLSVQSPASPFENTWRDNNLQIWNLNQLGFLNPGL